MSFLAFVFFSLKGLTFSVSCSSFLFDTWIVYLWLVSGPELEGPTDTHTGAGGEFGVYTDEAVLLMRGLASVFPWYVSWISA